MCPRVHYACAGKCYISLFRSLQSSHRLLDFDRREAGLSWARGWMGPFAPQSHAVLTVPLPLEKQYLYSKYEANEIYRFLLIYEYLYIAVCAYCTSSIGWGGVPNTFVLPTVLEQFDVPILYLWNHFTVTVFNFISP